MGFRTSTDARTYIKRRKLSILRSSTDARCCVLSFCLHFSPLSSSSCLPSLLLSLLLQLPAIVTHQQTPQIHHSFRTIRCSSSINHAQCRRLLRSQNSERRRKVSRAPKQQTEERQNVSSKTNNQTKEKHNKPNKHTISFFSFIFFVVAAVFLHSDVQQTRMLLHLALKTWVSRPRETDTRV